MDWIIEAKAMITSCDFSASYPDRPEPLSDALRLPQVDLSVFDEGDADGEVAALVQQLHVVNLGHSQLQKRDVAVN